jgi:hypothetical protein
MNRLMAPFYRGKYFVPFAFDIRSICMQSRFQSLLLQDLLTSSHVG